MFFFCVCVFFTSQTHTVSLVQGKTGEEQKLLREEMPYFFQVSIQYSGHVYSLKELLVTVIITANKVVPSQHNYVRSGVLVQCKNIFFISAVFVSQSPSCFLGLFSPLFPFCFCLPLSLYLSVSLSLAVIPAMTAA